MPKNYTRRDFLRIGAGLAAALSYEPITEALTIFNQKKRKTSPLESHKNSNSINHDLFPVKEPYEEKILTYPSPSSRYKTPTKRRDLYNIPGDHLLAMAISGEADNCTDDEQIAIAYTAINRLNDRRSHNGENSLTEVLLKRFRGRDQYVCFKDNSSDPEITVNFQRTLNLKKHDTKNWYRCLEIANRVIANQYPILNKNQTIYVTKNQIEEWEGEKNTPLWHKRSIQVRIPSKSFDEFKHRLAKDP